MDSNSQEYDWDEAKRISNLLKHGLDFRRAWVVLEGRYRLDVLSWRQGEKRIQSFSFVLGDLRVLTVVHKPGKRPRIISFRRASRSEQNVYFQWLENHDHDLGGDEGRL